jgi:carbon monoxide dehydrogenase subunit G
MIRINETIEIAAPPDQIWTILHNPAAVAGCIPGASLTGELGPGLYEATISIKFGPTVAHFTGEAKVEYDEAARQCKVSGRGNDRRGSSPASGSGIITLAGDATTQLSINGSFEVSGPLESFVETGGVFVARALLAQFAANIAELVGRSAAPASDGQTAIAKDTQPATVQQPAAPISAGSLMRAAFMQWLASLFKWIGGKGK